MTLQRVVPTLLVAFLFALPSAVGQNTLYSTDFSIPPYAAGDLLGQEGWMETGGPTTGNPVQVLGTEDIGLIHGSSNQDVNHNVGAVMGAGETWTYSFDLIVDSFGADLYFAHFKDDGFLFNGRLHIVAAVAGGDFSFGVSDTTSDGSPTETFATDGMFGTRYTVNMAYDFDAGISTLTMAGFGSISSLGDADPMQAMTSIGFRQSSSGDDDSTTMRIDNLTVTTSIPEPSSMALLGLAAIFGVVRRRK